MDTPVFVLFLLFCHFVQRKQLMTSCFLFCTLRPFRKWVYSKRKEFAPFSKGRQNIKTESSLQKMYSFALTLKMPRKPASENVVCLCHLLNILANFSNLFLHTGKQCGPWSDCSQTDLGPYCSQKWLLKSQADDKADDNCCDWQFKG